MKKLIYAWKSSKTTRIVVIALALLSMTCCCVVVATSLSENEEASESSVETVAADAVETDTPVPDATEPPAATAVPTKTPEPTVASEPTATSAPTQTVVPTSTPALTSTPFPVPTVTPGLPEDQLAYLLEMAAHADQYGELFELFSAQASAAGEDPLLLLDEDWVVSTAAVLAMMRVENEEIRETECPPGWKGSTYIWCWPASTTTDSRSSSRKGWTTPHRASWTSLWRSCCKGIPRSSQPQHSSQIWCSSKPVESEHHLAAKAVPQAPPWPLRHSWNTLAPPANVLYASSWATITVAVTSHLAWDP